MQTTTKLLDRIPRYMFIYVPMVIGSFVAGASGYFFGWQASIGMLTGALAWWAWECRQANIERQRMNDRMDRAEEQWKEIDAEFERLMRQSRGDDDDMPPRWWLQ